MKDTLTPAQVAKREEFRAKNRRVNAALQTKVKMKCPTRFMHFGIVTPGEDDQPIAPLWYRGNECVVMAPSAEGAEVVFAHLFPHNYAFSKN